MNADAHAAAMAWNWPAQTLRDCRLEICEAYFYDGPHAALMAVATASNELAVLVAERDLMPSAAWDTLQAVSSNLPLVKLFGQDAVQEAIASGPRLYATAHRMAA
jgi:hypothetical protein